LLTRLPPNSEEAEFAITENREKKREEKRTKKDEQRSKEPKEIIVPRKDAKK